MSVVRIIWNFTAKLFHSGILFLTHRIFLFAIWTKVRMRTESELFSHFNRKRICFFYNIRRTMLTKHVLFIVFSHQRIISHCEMILLWNFRILLLAVFNLIMQGKLPTTANCYNNIIDEIFCLISCQIKFF